MPGGVPAVLRREPAQVTGLSQDTHTQSHPGAVEMRLNMDVLGENWENSTWKQANLLAVERLC